MIIPSNFTANEFAFVLERFPATPKPETLSWQFLCENLKALPIDWRWEVVEDPGQKNLQALRSSPRSRFGRRKADAEGYGWSLGNGAWLNQAGAERRTLNRSKYYFDAKSKEPLTTLLLTATRLDRLPSKNHINECVDAFRQTLERLEQLELVAIDQDAAIVTLDRLDLHCSNIRKLR